MMPAARGWGGYVNYGYMGPGMGATRMGGLE